jgi:Protein of unknown function (DUF1700)
MSPQGDKLVEDYLKRLNRELRDLPRARRRELVDEIAEHISEARADLEPEDEATVRTLLDRLGAPEDIAAEARERFGVQRRSGALDIAALVLLLIGGVILPVVGWLVGVVLLWSSSIWTSREKLIGTLVIPGGLAAPLFLMTYGGSTELCVQMNGGPMTCTGGYSLARQVLMIALFIVLVVAPVVTAVFLARRRTRALAAA